MAATTLTNLVYPIYAKRHYVKHNAPDKFSDSLYTWDAGFTGLGLLELDAARAVECLNEYLTVPGDPHCAWIQHGTPLPVQIYLFLEIWNRLQSRGLLAHLYPKARQMYLFLAGRLGSSTARTLKSNLITTWDYFYNTGWDDYPPQMYMHQQRIRKTTAAVNSTAHAIRTAKILRMAAEALNLPDDLRIYNEDIETWTAALQTYAWDEPSGYYGYVLHDASGHPTGILRHPSGVNFDMGLDGAAPLHAGICNGAQEETVVGHLMSKQHLWTRIGLSTVDQSAPYYLKDGYWNGAVWMPHQWFFWKGLLDLGRGAEAWRIARAGIDVWKAETDATYHCFEHFIIESGRGAGWHQFGALSTPVLSWFAAYHRPGRLSCGCDAWIMGYRFADNNRSLEAKLKLYGPRGRSANVIATMDPAHRYRVTWAGEPARFDALHPGVLQILLANRPSEERLSVTAV